MYNNIPQKIFIVVDLVFLTFFFISDNSKVTSIQRIVLNVLFLISSQKDLSLVLTYLDIKNLIFSRNKLSHI